MKLFDLKKELWEQYELEFHFIILELSCTNWEDKRPVFIPQFLSTEEVILAEERTTEEEKMHIMEARRRAAKKRKLKKIGKSKSTDTEEEEQEEDIGDDGEISLNDSSHSFIFHIPIVVLEILHSPFTFSSI